MPLASYKLSRKFQKSNPREEMKRTKRLQIESLYDLAVDREDSALLNGEPFVKSPRVFDVRTTDESHTKLTIETIEDDDRFEIGDYVTLSDGIYLCIHSFIFHDLYCRGTFQKCNTNIHWLNEDGKLCSQWCIDLNTTQYNSGEQSGQYMRVGSTQHMLKMQCNEETVRLDSPKRIFLDKNMDNPTCYKVSQNDNTPYDYGSKGLCYITLAQAGKNTEADKCIILDDGTKVWVADYFEPDKEPEEKPIDPTPTEPDEPDTPVIEQTCTATIKYRYKKVYIGKKSTFTASFKDSDGNAVDKEPRWDIECDFKDSINIEETGSNLIILISDSGLIGQTFTLKLSAKDMTSSTASIEVSVESLI